MFTSEQDVLIHSHFFLSLKYAKQWGKTSPVQDLEQQLIAFVINVMPSYSRATVVRVAKAKGRSEHNEKLRWIIQDRVWAALQTMDEVQVWAVGPKDQRTTLKVTVSHMMNEAD